MFIQAVKDYITKDSYYFKDIQIKPCSENINYINTKLITFSINLDKLTTNTYDCLVEEISESYIR